MSAYKEGVIAGINHGYDTARVDTYNWLKQFAAGLPEEERKVVLDLALVLYLQSVDMGAKAADWVKEMS